MKIDWYGNNGYSFPKPGTVKKMICGVCGTPMKVKRNVLGPTGWAMAAAGRKCKHDSFACPHVKKDWHQRIHNLKIDVYLAEINKAVDYLKRKSLRKKKLKKF